MNRGQVKTRIKNTMQLDPGLISNAEREAFIDEVIDDLSDLGVWLNAYSASVSASPASLPTDFGEQIHAYWGGVRLKWTDKSRVPSTSSSGTPGWCYLAVDPSDGVTKLYLYPAPASSGTLLLHYLSRGKTPIATDAVGTGTDLNDLATFYGVPTEWHSLIYLGAVSRAFFKNGNVFMGDKYEEQYEKRKQIRYVASLEKLNAMKVQTPDPDFDTPMVSGDIFRSPLYDG